MKKIVICADDYGQAPAISQGILTLIEQSRLSAVSCMVNNLDWQAQAEALLPFRQQIDIGLHFNLTAGQPLSTAFRKHYGADFFTLPYVLVRASLGGWRLDVIAAELLAQMRHFKEALGFWPDFIDGHQHVHQFPQIRRALIATYKQIFSTKSAYIRLARSPINSLTMPGRVKKMIINQSAIGFLPLLKKEHIPFNTSFAGIYDFTKSIAYGDIFRQFVHQLSDKGLLMCHPGLEARHTTDSIGESRWNEFKFFQSESFLEICRLENCQISRFFD